MEKAIKLTLFVIGLAVVSLLGYDAFIIISAGREASISWQIISLSHSYPLIPFLFGVLMGHFFWNMQDPKGGAK